MDKKNEKDVEVVVEAFGNKSLKKRFAEEDIQGKSIEQLISSVVNLPWEGEENMVQQMIKSQLGASNGYTPKVYTGGFNQPVRFEPVKRNSRVGDYIKDKQLLINVTGDHVVGLKYLDK